MCGMKLLITKAVHGAKQLRVGTMRRGVISCSSLLRGCCLLCPAQLPAAGGGQRGEENDSSEGFPPSFGV